MASEPCDDERIGGSLANGLAGLHNELHGLRRAIAAGELAPVAIGAKLESIAETVQRLLAETARTLDGQSSPMQSEAAALVANLLTPREREVAEAVLTHGTSVLAAHAIGMSPSTLGHHRSNILRKLGANSFAQVASLFSAKP